MDAMAILLITEIMYNPKSPERAPAKTEWVEVYNPGDQAVDLKGWYLADEDGKTDPVTDDHARVPPHAAVVLVPAEVTADEFHKAWGDDITVYRLDHWNAGGLHGLANNPSPTNEDLTLRRSDGSVADEVNYDNKGDWPADQKGGPSIYLTPGHLDASANDHGRNWAASRDKTDGAHHANATDVFKDGDLGSPGVVALTATSPAPDASTGGQKAGDGGHKKDKPRHKGKPGSDKEAP